MIISEWMRLITRKRYPAIHTAKTKCRKFETNILIKGILRSQSQFPHSRVCERIIYAQYCPRWVCLFCWRKYVDRCWEYRNRSQTHECGNWGWGRAIPRKGIHKRNCRCSAVIQCTSKRAVSIQTHLLIRISTQFAVFSCIVMHYATSLIVEYCTTKCKRCFVLHSLQELF